MRNYYITIKASVTKTISIQAKNEDNAVAQAHEEFSVLNDGGDETYEQDVISVERDYSDA